MAWNPVHGPHVVACFVRHGPGKGCRCLVKDVFDVRWNVQAGEFSNGGTPGRQINVECISECLSSSIDVEEIGTGGIVRFLECFVQHDNALKEEYIVVVVVFFFVVVAFYIVVVAFFVVG